MDLSLKMKAGILFSILALSPMRVFAGEATLTGYGEAETAPEFITVMVKVTSECYSSATIVSTTNDNLANQVLDALKGVATAGEDEITASGGYVSRNSGYYTETRRPICINTFKKINQIQFKTKAVKKFAETFAILQDKIYGLGMPTNPNNIEEPTSYLEISAPQPGLSLANQKTFERKALTMALQDAKEKFESTIALAGIKTYKIVNYSEQPIRQHRNVDDKYEGGDRAAPPIAAPIELGNMTIRKYLYVQFEYTGGDLNLSF